MGNLKRSALISYFVIFFNIISGLLYTPWMINKLGDSDYGLFTLSISTISFFLFDFGIGNAISKFISLYRANNDEEAVTNFLAIVYKLFLCLTLVIFIALTSFYFLIDIIFLKLSAEELEKFKMIYIITGFFSVAAFPFTSINGVLAGYEMFVQLKIGSLFQKITSVVLTVVFLMMNKGLYEVVVINSIVGIFTVVYKMIILKRLRIKVAWAFLDPKIVRELFKFSFWIMIVGVIDQLVIINMPVIILGATVGASSITIFALSRTLYGYFWTFGEAINGLFMPTVAKISIQQNNSEEINALVLKVGRIQLLVMGLMIGGFIVVGRGFVSLWLGSGYDQVYFITLFLVLPFLVMLTQEIALTYLYIIDNAKQRAICSIMYLITAGTLSLMLGPRLSSFGIAISIFVANILFNIFMLNYFYFKNGIAVKTFFYNCHGKIFPVLCFCIVFCLFANRFIVIGGWFGFLIRGSLFVVTYLFVMWKIVLNSSEKSQLRQMIGEVVKYV